MGANCRRRCLLDRTRRRRMCVEVCRCGSRLLSLRSFATAPPRPPPPRLSTISVVAMRRDPRSDDARRRSVMAHRSGTPRYRCRSAAFGTFGYLRVASRSRRRTGKVGRAVARISETLRRPRLRVCPISSKPSNLLRLLHLARFCFDGVAICCVFPVCG